MQRNLHTEIEIQASAREVWTILTDFASYPEWNPFVRRISGELVVGRKLQVTLQQDPNRAAIRLKPEVVVHRPERSFAWRGKLLHTSLFVGEHRFEVEEIAPGRTKFVQSEAFDGFLVPLTWRLLDSKTRAAFDSMNRALKAETERRQAAND